MAQIAILGAGGFGISLGVAFSREGHQVTLWSHTPQTVEMLVKEREHKKLLAGILIPEDVVITGDIACAAHQDIVVVATPSKAVRETCCRIASLLSKKTVVVCVSKGLEKDTLKDMCQVMEEELTNPVVILSGPSHAEEVGRGEVTTVVAASRSQEAACYVQHTLMSRTLRIYVSDDVVGVELGGSLKNVIALAAGICDGLGLGDNAKAALMTRGLAEIARLGVAMGGKQETFAGLSGIGDLIVTCTSMHSRNRRAGILVGQGMTGAQAVEQVGMTVEGIGSTLAAYQMAKKLGVEMPIVTQMYQVLFQGKDPREAVQELMGRPGRSETESSWLGREPAEYINVEL